MVNQRRKVFIVALSDDQNLNDFKSILTLPPMLKELKKAMAIYESSLANNATFSELRSHRDRLKTRYLWKGIVSFSMPRPFFPFRRTEKEYIYFTDDLYLHNQILLEVFSSIPKDDSKDISVELPNFPR